MNRRMIITEARQTCWPQEKPSALLTLANSRGNSSEDFIFDDCIDRIPAKTHPSREGGNPYTVG
jgi:hypothetical protein